MLGHPQDAADAVQETFLRALRGLASLEKEAAIRPWLVTISTRVCLDELSRRKRREQPMVRPPGAPSDSIIFRPAEEWLAPIPDAWVLPGSGGETPMDALATKESIRLAFVAALQYLPPKQRAALLLTQVLGMSAAEVGEVLETSVASVNSALQRARGRLKELGAEARGGGEGAPEAVERYVSAFERFDVDGIVTLLCDDVRFAMPPISLWVQGPEDVARFLRTTGSECEGSILVPTAANGLPAFGQYRQGGEVPWGLVILELRGAQISGIHTFLDHEALFPLFGLPPQIRPEKKTHPLR